MICDFCSHVAPLWRYPCTTFTERAGGYRVVSPGAWAACAECVGLIEAGRVEDLAARARIAMRERYGALASHQEISDGIARLHAAFWAHRDGERVSLA